MCFLKFLFWKIKVSWICLQSITHLRIELLNYDLVFRTFFKYLEFIILCFFTLLLNRNKNCYRQEISECLIRKALQGTSGRKEQRDVLEKAIDATRFLLN